MTLKLKDRLLKSAPETPNISRLVKPLLTSYARANGGSYMLVEAKQNARDHSESLPEIHCLFSAEAAPAAADYATKLVEGFGIACNVFAKTHPELLNHLAPRATFSRERRSSSRRGLGD